MDKPAYNLITGINPYDMHRKYGAVVKLGLVMDAAELPFLLHDLSPKPPSGKMTWLELEKGVYLLITFDPETYYAALPA